MSNRPQDGIVDCTGSADGWSEAFHPHFKGFGAQANVFLLLPVDCLIFFVSRRFGHVAGPRCKIRCFVGVDEGGFDTCRLPVDNSGNLSRLTVGDEYVSFVQIRVQQSWFCDVLHPSLLDEIIKNTFTVCYKPDMILDRAPVR
jgi:hypothetical protein